MSENSLDSNFTSIKAAVEFEDIQDQYSYNEDFHCKFKFNDYQPQEGDRVAIFKLGWNFVKDYIVFEWTPVCQKPEECSVTFSKHNLPKNTTDIFEVCYISGDNELHGASSSFSFSLAPAESMFGGCQMTQSCLTSSCHMLKSSQFPKVNNMTCSLGRSSKSLEKSLISLEKEKNDEICRLKVENQLLKESLMAVLAQKETNLSIKNYDLDIKQLKELVGGLKNMLNTHQLEINTLKTKVIQGGEEYKKLYLEKAKIERKYEKLRRNKEEKEVKPINTLVSSNFDIGELKSMPSFPSIIKQFHSIQNKFLSGK